VSGGRFCVGAFGRNLSSVSVRMSSRVIYLKNKFYKLCSFNATCKDYCAINCINDQDKRCSFPSTLTGHTTLVNNITKRMSSPCQFI
jgi:hypothetical protein